MVDLQSGLRTVSGGIDYAYGLARGVKFGLHELVGVLADMDFTGLDALKHRLVYLEDARRDMEQIDIPISWLHGRYDAWMELERVCDLLSSGRTEKRKLVEVPVGHQMRTSEEAIEVFQLVTSEVSRMLDVPRVRPRIPQLDRLEKSRRSEVSRRPQRAVDLREFWRDYLVGRDRTLGIELMTSTAAYADLMRVQLQLLGPPSGGMFLDLGSGAGDFPIAIASSGSRAEDSKFVEVDFVTEGLRRAIERAKRFPTVCGNLRCIVADLDTTRSVRLPFADGVSSGALLSLVLSYVTKPEQLLDEVARVVRRGAPIVVSSLRRDADISRIYVDGVAELPPDRVRELFGADGERRFGELQRQFLNDAARLLSLEEDGRFSFWDPEELGMLLERAGFRLQKAEMAFGNPPQAIVLAATRQ